MSKLINALKAWPTREERLRKGLHVTLNNTDNADSHKTIASDGKEGERKTLARKLKLRSEQRKRRRELEEKQQSRKE